MEQNEYEPKNERGERMVYLGWGKKSESLLSRSSNILQFARQMGKPGFKSKGSLITGLVRWACQKGARGGGRGGGLTWTCPSRSICLGNTRILRSGAVSPPPPIIPKVNKTTTTKKEQRRKRRNKSNQIESNQIKSNRINKRGKK